jgi:hypothetical protein
VAVTIQEEGGRELKMEISAIEKMLATKKRSKNLLNVDLRQADEEIPLPIFRLMNEWRGGGS